MINWDEVPETCGKVAYQSRREAMEATRTRRKNHAVTRPYLCPSCGKWHMSSIRRPGDLFQKPWEPRG